MTIFDDLRASHAVQRSLARTMTHARASADNRRAAFLALAHELDAHATAEERHFYVPLLMDDAGLSVSRHALADHHKAEELVEELRGVDPTTERFDELAMQLSAEVRDHLDEEEHGTFQLAGKLLSKSRQRELARAYATYQRLMAEPSTPSVAVAVRTDPLPAGHPDRGPHAN